jgi:hypothetical protein
VDRNHLQELEVQERLALLEWPLKLLAMKKFKEMPLKMLTV